MVATFNPKKKLWLLATTTMLSLATPVAAQSVSDPISIGAAFMTYQEASVYLKVALLLLPHFLSIGRLPWMHRVWIYPILRYKPRLRFVLLMIQRCELC